MVSALHHVRKMRGACQSHLMYCSDGCFYVVKFQNNPQHSRVLVSEMLVNTLAERLGVPVPPSALVEVGSRLIESTPELSIQLPGKTLACQPGIHFGSLHLMCCCPGNVFDTFPSSLAKRLENLEAFAGALVLDFWTCNADFRQAVFSRPCRRKPAYRVTFIDHSHCLNASECNSLVCSPRGYYSAAWAYDWIKGWSSFESWLSRVETMTEAEIWSCTKGIPAEWYDGRSNEPEQLVNFLLARRPRLRQLIVKFRDSRSRPFPNWACACPQSLQEAS